MRVILRVAVVILFSAVSVIETTNINTGGSYNFTSTALNKTIISCHLWTPAGDTLKFSGVYSQHEDRYKFQPIDPRNPICAVFVKNLQKNDSGVWKLASEDIDGFNIFTFQMIVTEAETQTTDGFKEDVYENEWIIESPTRTDQIIDISLPRIDREEECFIRRQGQIFKASNIDIKGVTVHKRSSFVSCRITIGPMAVNLTGNWTVCGKYTKERIRCQRVIINWNREDNPATDWQTDVMTNFFHMSNNSTLNTEVKSMNNGEIVTCHIVTPNGEDLTVNKTSKYPFIKVTLVDYSCRFVIGPIQAVLLGNWTIYGLFRNNIEGLHEVRRSFKVYINDSRNYKEEKLLSGLKPNYMLKENRVRNRLNSSGLYPKKTFEKSRTITDSDYKNSIKQVPTPSYIDQNYSKRDKLIFYDTPQLVQTEIGLSHHFFIPSYEFVFGKNCHIKMPKGFVYQLKKGFNVAGIKFISEDGTGCGVIVTVESEVMAGEWTLIARAKNLSKSIERRLPFTINIGARTRQIGKENLKKHVRHRDPTLEFGRSEMIKSFDTMRLSCVFTTLILLTVIIGVLLGICL